MKHLSALKTKDYFFWDMYRFLNTVHFKRKSVFLSQRNGKKYTLAFRKKTFIQKYISAFCWLVPALILIYFVATLQMYFTIAIVLVIGYHMVAMWYIIRYHKMWIKEKTKK